MRLLQALLLSLLLAVCALGASTGLITLTSFPSLAVADGHSAVNIDAEVRDTAGRPVPDGTKVMFSCDRATFQNPVVSTINGVAHARLIAGSIAGIAKITANAITYGATANLDFELVSDRNLLSTAQEYITVTGDKTVSYSFDQKIVSASGAKKTAVLKYKDVEIRADQLQVNIDTYEVRAKNATLKEGKAEKIFGDLYLILNKRQGYGTTTFKRTVEGVESSGRFMKFVKSSREEDTYGIARVVAMEAKQPENLVDPGMFRFDDLSSTNTEITAKRVTAFPNKRVMFVGATVYVGNSRVMKVPLYQLDLVGQPRVFSDTILNVNNNAIAFNYPYYLSLKPGSSSLLRLQTGTSSGTGIAVNRGVNLSYEYNWDKGDDMLGGFSLQGLGRRDWGPKLTQYFRFGNGGSISAMLEAPSHQSLFGNFNVSEPLKGYELSFDASAGHSLTGSPFNTQDYNLSLEKQPFKIGNIPANFFIGLEAYSTSSESVGFFSDPTNQLAPFLHSRITDSQTAYGPRLRGQSQTLSLGPRTNMNASFSVAKLEGHNALTGLTYNGSLSFNHIWNKDFSTNISYDYTEDGFNSTLLGRQQATFETSYHHGNARLDFLGIQGLDASRGSYQAELSYQLTHLWRLGYAYQQQRYFGADYADFDVVLGYRVGYKEFGLVWSQKLHRIGFQLLGTTIN